MFIENGKKASLNRLLSAPLCSLSAPSISIPSIGHHSYSSEIHSIFFKFGVCTSRNELDCPLSVLRSYFAFWPEFPDRKSTRLNSSHVAISYAVFCLKKKNKPL